MTKDNFKTVVGIEANNRRRNSGYKLLLEDSKGKVTDSWSITEENSPDVYSSIVTWLENENWYEQYISTASSFYSYRRYWAGTCKRKLNDNQKRALSSIIAAQLTWASKEPGRVFGNGRVWGSDINRRTMAILGQVGALYQQHDKDAGMYGRNTYIDMTHPMVVELRKVEEERARTRFERDNERELVQVAADKNICKLLTAANISRDEYRIKSIVSMDSFTLTIPLDLSMRFNRPKVTIRHTKNQYHDTWKIGAENVDNMDEGLVRKLQDALTKAQRIVEVLKEDE